ncbi:MAG: helix-turn-helix transcriptional regulator [Nitrospira sp.]|jgi:transcriptional regulator with XRE-family HTH domain|nr:helix-turn-helix transcriptional regulator [Nitrospira sp.]
MTQGKNSECISFGERLRELRKKKGFSQEGFADHAEVHRTYLGGLERGERNPTLTVMVKIARALDVPLSKLVKGVEAAK